MSKQQQTIRPDREERTGLFTLRQAQGERAGLTWVKNSKPFALSARNGLDYLPFDRLRVNGLD